MYVGRGRASGRRPRFEGTIESAVDKCVRIVDKRLESMRGCSLLIPCRVWSRIITEVVETSEVGGRRNYEGTSQR